MQDDTRSRFNGLGIEVSMKNGLPTVITAMEDTPAARAGIFQAIKSCESMGCPPKEWIFRMRLTFYAGPQAQK